MPDIVLATLIVVPVLITYVFKSNAALGFLALCVGFVLSTSVVGDLKHLLSETNLSVASNTLALALISLPYLFTLLLCRKTHARGPMLIANLVAALLGGGLLALAAGPLINAVSTINILDDNFWKQLIKYQSAIIGAGALLSLVLVWLSPKHSKKH